MFNYLGGEIYRILHKKSFYIYFAAFTLLYLIFTMIRDNIGPEAIEDDAQMLSVFLVPIAGGYLFNTLYVDDLQAKNLTTLIGFGMSKVSIVVSKFMMMLLSSIVIIGLAPIFMYIFYAIFVGPASMSMMGSVYIFMLKSLILTIAFAGISSIFVYGLQRPIFGMAIYLLLAFGLISQLLGMLFEWHVISNIFPGLSKHLMASVSSEVIDGLLSGTTVIMPVIEVIIYIAATTTIATLAFYRKELEF